jgi:ketosteroid isomerase-like protein
MAMSEPAWIDDLFASIDAMDPDTFVSFVTDDAVFRYGSNPPTDGKPAIREAVAGFFSMFKGLSHTLEGRWVAGETVFVEGQVHYERHDGSTVTLPFMNCFKMRGDKIREYLIYIDPTPLAA